MNLATGFRKGGLKWLKEGGDPGKMKCRYVSGSGMQIGKL
jgi:hypothetical protein